jgi:Holliday junction resolvasome RuvABC endonuclease subunit
MQKPIILGIDPGTRYMGVVVLQGRELLSYGVHTLRNGERPYDVIGQAKSIVLGYAARWSPTIVAYEEPLPIATGQGAILRVIANELRGRGKELGLEVWSASPAAVREKILGNPKATKLELAHALVERGFEDLRVKLPQKPRRSAIGYRAKDRYWLHMFDALGVAVTADLTG